MFSRKCKCDCEMKLFIQKMQFQWDLCTVANEIERLRMELNYFKSEITGRMPNEQNTNPMFKELMTRIYE